MVNFQQLQCCSVMYSKMNFESLDDLNSSITVSAKLSKAITRQVKLGCGNICLSVYYHTNNVSKIMLKPKAYFKIDIILNN